MSKTEYYRQYHLKTYVPKKRNCIVCDKDLRGTGPTTKKCKECRLTCICEKCGKEFSSKRQKFPRCGQCQYNHYKEKTPEKFDNSMEKRYLKIANKRREVKNLPLDHIFFNGPKKEGYLNKKGYRLMLELDPEIGKYRRVYEHVLVMEEFMKRRLIKGETVHHKNGIRDDNRIENLELWNKGQPAGQRVEDRIKYYIEFLMVYGYKVIKD